MSKARCLEFFKRDISAGTLKLTVNQCCHSHSSRGKVRPNFIYKGMKAQCLWSLLFSRIVHNFQAFFFSCLLLLFLCLYHSFSLSLFIFNSPIPLLPFLPFHPFLFAFLISFIPSRGTTTLLHLLPSRILYLSHIL